MANTLNLGNGNWATKKDSLLAYNSENGNFKPLPFDFTRASSGTVVNKEGLVERVDSGKPRIDFKDNTKGSLLLEPERLQKIQYSEDIESWSTTGVITKENNVSISPDGTLNAGTITSNASNFDRITQTISVSANSTYTGSLFIKKVQSQTNYMGIGFIFTGGTTDVGYVIFDAVNGIAVSADARIDVISEVKDFGDYWRLQSTATDNGSNTSLQFNIYATLSTNGTTNGLGISSPRTIWGIQLEQGSYATSYIPTSGSAVTRVADSCDNGGNEQVFNDNEGVLYVEVSALADDRIAEGISISDGTIDNRVVIFKWTTNNSFLKVRVTSGGTNYFDKTVSISDITAMNKIAIKYKQNDFSLWVNGIELETDTSGITPIGLSKLNINGATSSSAFKGNVKDVRVYNTALTDAQLQALTQ